MPGLGETTAMLARLRRETDKTFAGQGRLTRTATFGPNPGQLEMLSYRPEQLASRAPLVVVLHGCTQTAGGYAEAAGWLSLADRLGFMVVAAEQPSANNPNRCFNWFAPGDVRRGEGEVASIASMVTHALEVHDLDPQRVFITGLSAGGAMAAAMLATYPELFAAGAVIAGLPYGVARNVQDALRVMGRPDGRPATDLGKLAPRSLGGATPPRLSIWHGDADYTVQVGNAHDLAQQWSAVMGLASAPECVEPQSFGERSIWRSDAGEVLIELNLVKGLGHGTPLSTRTVDSVGKVAPYMLEAGVSSSLEIARFWKLDAARLDRVDESLVPSMHGAAQEERPRLAASRSVEDRSLGHSVMQAISQVPVGVQDVVAKALRAAGLMK